MEWLSCRDGFIEADVIRFREPVWKPKTTKRSATRKIGERELTAEVLRREAGGWVRLKVSRCETKNAENWLWTIADIKPGAVIRRHTDTVRRGKPARLAWTDESAREAVLRAR